ncbi:ABC transporter ATP-binding protein [Synergistales bacterium]|nr:ABC transporter ATP-binding protein [Synergistales bacterium]
MSDAPIIEVKNLTKRFKGLKAVSDVSFFIEKDKISGMIGPNGAGKTTTFNMVSGFYPPTSGQIFYEQREITNRRAHEYSDMGIARTFQIMKPLANLTVLDNVVSGAFFGLHKAKNLKEAQDIALEILNFTDLYRKRDALAKDMGTPDQKRLEIARALAANPRMILLDEAMAGLNPTETDGAIELIFKIRDSGVTVFMIEHVMRAVVKLCEKIVVLHHGEKIAEGTPQEVMNNPHVIEVYLGSRENHHA